MRLIDADQMAVDESEAYISAQVQITDDLKWLVNFAAHSKIQRLISDAPTVDAVPVVHGRWVEYPRPHYFKCSECKYTVPYRKAMWCNGKREYNYCPNCGAKMDGGEEDASV